MSEGITDSDESATRLQRIAWLYTVSRRSLGLARRYVGEGEGGRTRANACVRAVREYRDEVRALRETSNVEGPGLAFTDGEVAESAPAKRNAG